MPARSLLRGRSVFIAFVALWVCTGAVKGQEILKELEQTDSRCNQGAFGSQP